MVLELEVVMRMVLGLVVISFSVWLVMVVFECVNCLLVMILMLGVLVVVVVVNFFN